MLRVSRSTFATLLVLFSIGAGACTESDVPAAGTAPVETRAPVVSGTTLPSASPSATPAPTSIAATATPSPAAIRSPYALEFVLTDAEKTRTGPAGGYVFGPTVPAGTIIRVVARNGAYFLLDSGYWLHLGAVGVPRPLRDNLEGIPIRHFAPEPRTSWPRTMIPEVDAMLAALESHDRAALTAVHGGISATCAEIEMFRLKAYDAPGPCAHGETQADIHLGVSCDTGYWSADAGIAASVEILARSPRLWLYSINRASPISFFKVGPASAPEWIVIVNAQAADGSDAPRSLAVRDGKIIGTRSYCGDIGGRNGPGGLIIPSFEYVEFLVPPP